MIEKNIKHIAYQLKQNKKDGQPGAIVFIGAGCSVSAGIPTTNKIVEFVLEEYKDNPAFESIGDKPTYAEVMNCLGPRRRRDVFRKYVETAKINVSHIYLAQLMKLGFVDYIVTVNFDNLTQRALALVDIFPPTYDISILKDIDLATTALDEQSIIYLHGQYNGLWQLNTKEEMDKVITNRVAFNIFNKITTNRPWIVVGYSGEDFIFDQLIQLQRFYDNLFWVGYKDNEPLQRVREKLLDKPNTESFWVKGHDSDSFFLKLNAEIEKDGPKIFSTPFTFLSGLLENITDIDDSKEYKSVKERLVGSKEMVKDAINTYETQGNSELKMTGEAIERTQLKNALIDCLVNAKYDDLAGLEKQVNDKGYADLLIDIANIYFDWGVDLGDLAETMPIEETEDLYKQVFEKYSRAIAIKPNYHEAYFNWGVGLGVLAGTKFDQDAQKLYKQAFEKYDRAIEIKPNYYEAYNNWGIDLGRLAEIKFSPESEELYLQAFEKFKKAIEVKSDYSEAYYNWGTNLGKLAGTKSGKESEELYWLSFEKFKKAIEVKSDYSEAYYNWGTGLGILAGTKSGRESEELYKQSFEKYSRAIEIKPNYHEAYYNWGLSLGELAGTKIGRESEELYKQSIEKYNRAAAIKPDKQEAYNNWGICLGNLAGTKSGKESEELYKLAFEKFKRAIAIEPDQPEAYYNWGTNLGEFAGTKSGKESEELYKLAFEKYSRVIMITPDHNETYNNWGFFLEKMAETKIGQKTEILYSQSIEKYKKAIELGSSSYNLACLYAKTGNINEAFRLLEICLQKNEKTFEFVETDSDWEGLREEGEYLRLKELYFK